MTVVLVVGVELCGVLIGNGLGWWWVECGGVPDGSLQVENAEQCPVHTQWETALIAILCRASSSEGKVRQCIIPPATWNAGRGSIDRWDVPVAAGPVHHITPLLPLISLSFPTTYWLADYFPLLYSLPVSVPLSHCHSLHPEDGGSKVIQKFVPYHNTTKHHNPNTLTWIFTATKISILCTECLTSYSWMFTVQELTSCALTRASSSASLSLLSNSWTCSSACCNCVFNFATVLGSTPADILCLYNIRIHQKFLEIKSTVQFGGYWSVREIPSPAPSLQNPAIVLFPDPVQTYSHFHDTFLKDPPYY